MNKTKKTIEASLNEDFTHPVRDVLWGHIYMTEKIAELTSSAPFIRLCRIFQLGPVYLTYPGATHTRASHSIGVYHLARRLLQNLTERGASEWLTPEGVKSFLCACLLHDLGHFPYTHSLKDISLASHESLSGAIILKEPMKTLIGNAGADPEFTAAIVDKELNVSDSELFFYRKLLSGALDPDKLDYLNRDARYCGVPYGSQDADFILSRLNPSIDRGVDIDSRLIPNVESLLFSKYMMYRTVYWHHQVRSATAMIKKALIGGLMSGKIAAEDLYDLDDHSLFTLLNEKINSPYAEMVKQGRIFATAMEFPINKLESGKIKTISHKAKLEELIAAEINKMGIPMKGDDLIIDIPEPVSFETGLFVKDENCDFNDSSSAFKTETLGSFVNTLYTVRIFTDQKFKQKLKTIPKIHDMILYRLKEGE